MKRLSLLVHLIRLSAYISLVLMASIHGPPLNAATPTQITVAIGSDWTTFSETVTNAGTWNTKNPTLSIGTGDYGYGSTVSSFCTSIWNVAVPTNGDGILVIGTHDTDNPDRLTNDNGVGSTGTWEASAGYENTCGLKGTGINWIGSGTVSNNRACDTANVATNIFTCLGREGYFDYPSATPVARFIVTCDGINSTPNATAWCNYDSTTNDGKAHFTWLDAVISAGKNRGEWTIVLNHVEDWNGFEGTQYPDDFWNHMITGGVDLLIQGGNHAYERSYPLTCQKTNGAANWYQGVNATSNACIASTNANTYAKSQGLIYLTDGDVGQSFHNFCQFTTDKDITGTACTQSHYTDWKSNNGYFAVNNDTTWGFNYLTIQQTGLTSTYVNCPKTSCDYSSTGIPAGAQGGFTDTFTIGNLLSTTTGGTRVGCGACTPLTVTNATGGTPITIPTWLVYTVLAAVSSILVILVILRNPRKH
jgi:hypothetical protein